MHSSVADMMDASVPIKTMELNNIGRGLYFIGRPLENTWFCCHEFWCLTLLRGERTRGQCRIGPPPCVCIVPLSASEITSVQPSPVDPKTST